LIIQDGDLGMEMADEGELVLESQLVNAVGFLGQSMFLPAVAVGARVGDAVVSQLMGLDAGDEFSAFPHEMETLAQESSQGALGGRINVTGWDEIDAQQLSEFFGIDAIIFVFATMNGLEVEGVSQDEMDVGLGTGVSKPIPPEHAFGTDGQVMAIRGDQLQEEVEVIVSDIGMDEDFSRTVHEADIHLAGMEIDSAVEFSGRGVILHG
jgi:hypothetical protein